MNATVEEVDWNALAFERMSRVLGEANVQSIMKQGLEQSGLDALRTADDLYRFAQQLLAMPGFAKTVGGMLSLQAVMHGGGPRA